MQLRVSGGVVIQQRAAAVRRPVVDGDDFEPFRSDRLMEDRIKTPPQIRLDVPNRNDDRNVDERPRERELPFSQRRSYPDHPHLRRITRSTIAQLEKGAGIGAKQGNKRDKRECQLAAASM